MQSDELLIAPLKGVGKRLKSALREIRKAISFSAVNKKTKFTKNLKKS